MNGLNEFYRACAFPKAGKPEKVSKPLTAKPADKGIVAKERHQKKLKQARTKAATREHVRELDGMRCRWPECDTDPETPAGALEVAHQQAEGAGGDPMLVRYEPENLLVLCHAHHRGDARSLHSGLARMDALTELGMRGPVLFQKRDTTESARWYVVGVSDPPKVSE